MELTRRLFTAALCGAAAAAGSEPGFTPLFNGKNLDGWEGDRKLWIVENGMLIGRSPGIKQNEFLATAKRYGDFVLRFEIHLLHDHGNSGVQFRSERVEGSSEMSGYQADVGEGWWGSLYDESRRRVTLVEADKAALARALKKDDWNDYAVRAEGKRIVLKINGATTVDYTEKDAGIAETGRIAVQVHSGDALEVRFRNLRIREL